MDRLPVAISVIVRQFQKNRGTINELLEQYIDPVDGDYLMKEEKDEILPQIQRKIELEEGKKYRYSESEDPALIVNPEGHEDWFEEWLKTNNTETKRYYWKNLENFLEKKLTEKVSSKKAGEVIGSIDNASNKVVERLENPSRPSFNTKGLVIGHVQSGKTANFTAVIAKAVDAGYRFIIVLAGLHNNLRSQTQLRLDSELTGEPFSADVEHVDIPLLAGRQWVRLTDERDFTDSTTLRLETLAQSGRPILVVMKKKPQIMRKLIKWIKKAPEDIRRTIPLLMIDDEADQASTNTGRNGKVTPTNAHIRVILRYFTKHAYVGYTATPFANLLIDMSTNSDEIGRDLYPRNFIVSLPRPDDYMGAEQIFSKGQADKYVITVPDHEAEEFDSKSETQLTMTPSLKESILSYCLSAAARYHRKHKHKPMTMLIHTTHLQDGHSDIKSIVKCFIDDLKRELKDKNAQKFYLAFKDLWLKNFLPITQELYPDRKTSFEEIQPYILEFLCDLDVLELNARSTDVLDYTQKTDIKVIAIGGNTLSRGLTLEGLMTSYFIRKSDAYDTLLQMGRWFGYREGYEDLTRVYTTKKLSGYFEDLALVEQEIREELFRYQEDEVTPAQVAVKIRAHKEMKITAPNKMGAAKTIEPTYSGKLAQTIWLPLDKPEILRKNLLISEKFIQNIKDTVSWTRNKGNHLAYNVPVELILNTLEQFEFSYQSGFDTNSIISYIRRVSTEFSRKELTVWNVAVPGQNKSKPSHNKSVQFGGLDIIPVTRSRRNTQLKIGVLTNEMDLVMDKEDKVEPHIRENPLLLIYRIWKDSTPERNKLGRLAPLFAGYEEKEDAIGLAIVFPKSRNQTEDYIAQNAESS
ncbi:Z1 domain-containing protein [Priestia megaterium]|uniref:Z1 domain-containing protein n=1 Tax=Priestia megaterium TaxID=1404 RepID=UPI003458E968